MLAERTGRRLGLFHGRCPHHSGYYGAMAKLNMDMAGPTSLSKHIERPFDVDEHATKGVADATVSVAGIMPVTAGDHDFFMALRSGGAGTVRLNKPAISVIYLPRNSPELIPYYFPVAEDTWTTDATDFEIRVTTFNAAEKRWAFILANASVWASTDTCRGQFSIGVDSGTGDDNYVRTVARYPDSGDGAGDDRHPLGLFRRQGILWHLHAAGDQSDVDDSDAGSAVVPNIPTPGDSVRNREHY